MKLRCPIPFQYLKKGYIMVTHQLFGENANKVLDGGVKYGPKGHEGIDIKTTRIYKYERVGNWTWKDKWILGPNSGFKQSLREPLEANGRIPLLAAHDGTLSYILQENKQRDGWGAWLVADEEIENGQTAQYRTLYWHIESPWRKLAPFQSMDESIYRELAKQYESIGVRVKTGQVILVGGNNGMSSGPHLHLELHKRVKTNGKWSEWKEIDPIPYFTVNEDVMINTSEVDLYSNDIYMGKFITDAEAKLITKDWPKVL